MNKKSKIWNYFTEFGRDKAKCKICEKVYSRKGRTTSGLILHLKVQHSEQYTEFSTEKNQQTKELQSSNKKCHQVNKQLTLSETIQRKECWPLCHPKTLEFDFCISEMIALHNLPFNFVESVGFRRLLQRALPRYKIRGREHFTKLCCGDLYEKVADKIKLLLNTFEHISFTTDIWSDTSSGVSLLSLTAHGVSEDMKKMNIVLKCCPVIGSHTGDTVSSNIEQMLNEWNLNGKVHCIVHDEGTNMARAMRISNLTHVSCAVHQLQLCVKFLFSYKNIANVLDKCRKICGHFNHSILAQDELKNIQTETLGQPNLSVVQDCPTRWNSTFYMLQRLIKIKDSVVLYLYGNNKFTIFPDDWAVMEKCVTILMPN